MTTVAGAFCSRSIGGVVALLDSSLARYSEGRDAADDPVGAIGKRGLVDDGIADCGLDAVAVAPEEGMIAYPVRWFGR